MTVKSFEKMMERELKEKVGNKASWVEWRTDEAGAKKNLREGEKLIFLPLTAVWVSYKFKT